MPQGSNWYYSQYEPERERNNAFVGFLILVAFILASIFGLTFLAERFGKNSPKNVESKEKIESSVLDEKSIMVYSITALPSTSHKD